MVKPAVLLWEASCWIEGRRGEGGALGNSPALSVEKVLMWRRSHCSFVLGMGWFVPHSGGSVEAGACVVGAKT